MKRAAADVCGTPSGYKRGCRCTPCREAHAEHTAAQKRDRVIRAAADPSLVPHGTQSGYVNWSCRCTPCCEANRAARHSADRAVNGYRPWTDAERDIAMQDRPIREIAAELGRTYHAVLTMRYQQRQQQERQQLQNQQRIRSASGSVLTAHKEAS
ncbi:hypothetical protein [Actinomadura violacea]|uniref:Uncharacterized protein n=1 Tax=Actinomadura violacea TaxID=2819934 RepID=A0ABS3S7B2_9ACTN|nr:hypothetical protein [Actinomadura violacea]MBO2464468.1 hypothetical protein [Actinomadura violacea]